MTATVIPIGTPVNDAERLAIAHLRDRLPKGYTLIHNFEVHHHGGHFEVDLAVVAPHALYLIDIKGTGGRIEVDGTWWHPADRVPFKSPLLKLRGHARALKGAILDREPARARDLGRVWVGALVILTAPDARLLDRAGHDAPEVLRLEDAVAFLTDPGRVPPQFDRALGRDAELFARALGAVVRKGQDRVRFGNWEVCERFSAGEGYTEYRAVNPFAGPGAGTVRLRLYRPDPYQPEEARAAERRLIVNSFRALSRLPAHGGILGARDFFELEDEGACCLVMDEVPGAALRLHLERPELALTLDQKLRLADELLGALAHAHAHGVVHRNLSPAAVLLAQDGHLRLTGFDYARTGDPGSHTVAGQIAAELDRDYQAPELEAGPAAATRASDLFSAGLILYEVFAGERPFADFTSMYALNGVFPQPASAAGSALPAGLDDWLQSLCAFDPEARPDSAGARDALRRLVAEADAAPAPAGAAPGPVPAAAPEPAPDYLALKPGTPLGQKFVVLERLGRPGAFGVVYKAVDTLGDVTRAVKLILRDRESTLKRLKQEYQTLLRVPEHPHVVRVIDADVLPLDRTPYIVFEYLDGIDCADLLKDRPMDPEDVLTLARQAAAGLAHLHHHHVFHCDIKPGNLLWTAGGVRIIDFNVAVNTDRDEGPGGGTRRYLPPDLDPDLDPSAPGARDALADRDLYALGITLYQALTGRYPWEGAAPPARQPAPDPRDFTGCADLAGPLVETLLRLIAPTRDERWGDAEAVLKALGPIRQARRPRLPALTDLTEHRPTRPDPAGTGPAPANTNPFVGYLLTLYSQSRTSNAGTRGLDERGARCYVETALDRDLVEAVLSGGLRLVIVTGNAGDGKTAFLQTLERRARKQGAVLDHSPVNGCRFTLSGRSFLSNYDGSQDEGDKTSDAVLLDFFAPFAGPAGPTPDGEPALETRLIAINEGRLIDFLSGREERFAALAAVVRRGLATGAREDGIAVVNLNLRSVVAPSRTDGESLVRRMLRRLVLPEFWEPCGRCDLAGRCYVQHNALTFQDAGAGGQVLERLELLYALTHLRARLHITLRDLRSALAFMLAGTRDCAEVHALYARGDPAAVLSGFYFNSWMGGAEGSPDRLLALLAQLDMGPVPDPRLDRGLGFVSPGEESAQLRFAERGGYDLELLRTLFQDLPRGVGAAGAPTERERIRRHRDYLGMARRRHFFERRDGASAAMLPYAAGPRMLAAVRGELEPADLLTGLIGAINRGEGLSDTGRLGGQLALQVRRVEKGTIRSYRLFARERFALCVSDEACRADFIEHMPDRLLLGYCDDRGGRASMPITLDVFEMLERLNQGYRPGVEEGQGLYLSLEVFKNLLASASYQEVLLTTSGHDFYRIRRAPGGKLTMDQPAAGTP